jgi:hypothetical protein
LIVKDQETEQGLDIDRLKDKVPLIKELMLKTKIIKKWKMKSAKLKKP